MEQLQLKIDRVNLWNHHTMCTKNKKGVCEAASYPPNYSPRISLFRILLFEINTLCVKETSLSHQKYAYVWILRFCAMTIYELPHCGSYGEWELNVNFILNATFQIVIHVERVAVIPSFENIISDHLKKTLEFRIFL